MKLLPSKRPTRAAKNPRHPWRQYAAAAWEAKNAVHKGLDDDARQRVVAVQERMGIRA